MGLTTVKELFSPPFPQPTFHVIGISVDGEIKLLTVQVGSDYINVGCARVISIPRTLSLITLVSLILNLISLVGWYSNLFLGNHNVACVL